MYMGIMKCFHKIAHLKNAGLTVHNGLVFTRNEGF